MEPRARRSSTSSSLSAKPGPSTASSRPTSLDPATTVLNLLSEGIVNPDGTPGPNYNKALQFCGTDYDSFQLAPRKTPWMTLPPAMQAAPTRPTAVS